jgi:hypothetical protein
MTDLVMTRKVEGSNGPFALMIEPEVTKKRLKDPSRNLERRRTVYSSQLHVEGSRQELCRMHVQYASFRRESFNGTEIVQ